jgi:hypothetical protein
VHPAQHLRDLVLGRPRVSTAVAWLTAMWRGDHLPCKVSEHRDFATSRPSEPERFTALVTGQLLARVPEAAALVGQIARSQAAALRGSTRVHFFLDASRLPADTNCTAVAYLLLLQTGGVTEDEAHRAFDEIARAVTPDGVITTYFEPVGDRANIVDAVVCANTLRLAHRLGRATEVTRTARYVWSVVRNGAYLGGTRYYPSPDSLLYALSRGMPFDELRAATARRIGTTGSTIDLAQRALTTDRLALDGSIDRERLLERREADGTWAPDGWFCYGRSREWFGSRALTTAFALAALHGMT